jgi:hypothetical protein
VLVIPDRLAAVAAGTRQTRECEVHVHVLGAQLAETQQRACGRIPIAAAAERFGEREDVALLAAVLHRGTPERHGRGFRVGLGKVFLAARVPGGGILQGEVLRAQAEGSRTQKGASRDGGQDDQSHRLAPHDVAQLQDALGAGEFPHGIRISRRGPRSRAPLDFARGALSIVEGRRAASRRAGFTGGPRYAWRAAR